MASGENKWYTGSPETDGFYLVTVQWMGRRLVFVDRYTEMLGFEEYHDDVLAWAYLPEPFRG